MATEVFHIGAVVSLRSGGPLMTVVGMADSDNVRCVWFAEGEREPNKADFPCAVLVLEHHKKATAER